MGFALRGYFIEIVMDIAKEGSTARKYRCRELRTTARNAVRFQLLS
jgi:hypothetical protein